MKIKPNYNPESSEFTVEITTDLFKDYFFNFRGMVLDSENTPKDVVVVKKDTNTALVSFKVDKEVMKSSEKSLPSDILSKFSSMLGVSPDSITGGVMVEADKIPEFKNLQDIIQKFTEAASIYKFNKTEFIPLENYSVENLKSDCIAAISAKRDFCIVDDFIKYKKAMDTVNYNMEHYIVPYGTSEYVDVALYLLNDKFSDLVKLIKPKLKMKVWLKY